MGMSVRRAQARGGERDTGVDFERRLMRDRDAESIHHAGLESAGGPEVQAPGRQLFHRGGAASLRAYAGTPPVSKPPRTPALATIAIPRFSKLVSTRGTSKSEATLQAMPRKKQEPSEFGSRLAAIRKERGMTQVELAKVIGSTQRAIFYYESFKGYPPALAVAHLARALDVSTDELLGLERRPKTRDEMEDPDTRRLWRKLKRLLELPPADRRALMRTIVTLIDSYQIKAARRSA
jgi:transcriptional regulator with XRE-family HTH domain